MRKLRLGGGPLSSFGFECQSWKISSWLCSRSNPNPRWVTRCLSEEKIVLASMRIFGQLFILVDTCKHDYWAIHADRCEKGTAQVVKDIRSCILLLRCRPTRVWTLPHQVCRLLGVRPDFQKRRAWEGSSGTFWAQLDLNTVIWFKPLSSNSSLIEMLWNADWRGLVPCLGHPCWWATQELCELVEMQTYDRAFPMGRRSSQQRESFKMFRERRHFHQTFLRVRRSHFADSWLVISKNIFIKWQRAQRKHNIFSDMLITSHLLAHKDFSWFNAAWMVTHCWPPTPTCCASRSLTFRRQNRTTRKRCSFSVFVSPESARNLWRIWQLKMTRHNAKPGYLNHDEWQLQQASQRVKAQLSFDCTTNSFWKECKNIFQTLEFMQPDYTIRFPVLLQHEILRDGDSSSLRSDPLTFWIVCGPAPLKHKPE